MSQQPADFPQTSFPERNLNPMDTEDKPPSESIAIGIRWLEAASDPCVVCEQDVGTGPVGFKTDEPAGSLCDGCLLEANHDLGMMILMVHVVRELATAAEGINDPWKADEIMLSLMLFAKVYNQGATWIRRPIAAREFVAELQNATAKIPITVVLKALLGDRR